MRVRGGGVGWKVKVLTEHILALVGLAVIWVLGRRWRGRRGGLPGGASAGLHAGAVVGVRGWPRRHPAALRRA